MAVPQPGSWGPWWGHLLPHPLWLTQSPGSPVQFHLQGPAPPEDIKTDRSLLLITCHHPCPGAFPSSPTHFPPTSRTVTLRPTATVVVRTTGVGLGGRVGAVVSVLGVSVEVWRKDTGVSGLRSSQLRQKGEKGGVSPAPLPVWGSGCNRIPRELKKGGGGASH